MTIIKITILFENFDFNVDRLIYFKNNTDRFQRLICLLK